MAISFLMENNYPSPTSTRLFIKTLTSLEKVGTVTILYLKENNKFSRSWFSLLFYRKDARAVKLIPRVLAVQ
jgi:hypothetical protein